jgi:hypothetical protein
MGNRRRVAIAVLLFGSHAYAGVGRDLVTKDAFAISADGTQVALTTTAEIDNFAGEIRAIKIIVAAVGETEGEAVANFDLWQVVKGCDVDTPTLGTRNGDAGGVNCSPQPIRGFAAGVETIEKRMAKGKFALVPFRAGSGVDKPLDVDGLAVTVTTKRADKTVTATLVVKSKNARVTSMTHSFQGDEEFELDRAELIGAALVRGKQPYLYLRWRSHLTHDPGHGHVTEEGDNWSALEIDPKYVPAAKK